MSSPSDARPASPRERSWLEIRTSAADARGRIAVKPSTHISVPKKIVRLATDRNRLKRLLKEAIRGEAFFTSPGIHFLKITANPLPASLEKARTALAKALESPKRN